MQVREYAAAGGVVVDDAGRVLLLERWLERNGAPFRELRLPKGHVEDGETDEQAALRETCEESGYCALQVVADLGAAVTEFDLPGERVRRTEHYYLMQLTDPQRGEPNFQGPEEALFRPVWVSDLGAAEQQLTFASEIQFATRALMLTSAEEFAAPSSAGAET